jgi:protein TonB
MNRECIQCRISAQSGRNWLLCLAASLLASACAVHRAEAPRARSENLPAPTAPAAPAPMTVPESSARTLDAYKQEVARWIYRSSAENLFHGAPPPMLKSIVVLTVTVDANGQPKHVAVQRSNGYGALNQLAMQSVKRAAPLPRPGRSLMRGGVAEFSETWLFRDDGRFQIRSLAQVQARGDD